MHAKFQLPKWLKYTCLGWGASLSSNWTELGLNLNWAWQYLIWTFLSWKSRPRTKIVFLQFCFPIVIRTFASLFHKRIIWLNHLLYEKHLALVPILFIIIVNCYMKLVQVSQVQVWACRQDRYNYNITYRWRWGVISKKQWILITVL